MSIETTSIKMLPDGRMTLSEAAKYIGIEPPTLRALKNKGKGPAYIKIGKVYYFKDDIDSWLLKDGKKQ